MDTTEVPGYQSRNKTVEENCAPDTDLCTKEVTSISDEKAVQLPPSVTLSSDEKAVQLPPSVTLSSDEKAVQPPASVTPSSHEKAVQPPASRSPFHIGFADCAAEAVRFLVQEELLPDNSDVITKLRHHLDEQNSIKTKSEKERFEDLVKEGTKYLVVRETNVDETNADLVDCDVGCVNDKENEDTIHEEEESTVSSDTSSLSLDSSVNISGTSTDSGVDTATEGGLLYPNNHSSPLATRLPDNRASPLVTDLEQSLRTPSPIPGVKPSQPPSPNSVFIEELVCVAQNNPSVAAITEELFQLLEEEEDMLSVGTRGVDIS